MCQLVTTNSILFDENLKESTLLSWNLACRNVQVWASHFPSKQQDLKKANTFKSKPMCGGAMLKSYHGGFLCCPHGNWEVGSISRYTEGLCRSSLNCWSALACPESSIPCPLLLCQLSMYGNMAMHRRDHGGSQKGMWPCTEENMAMHRREEKPKVNYQKSQLTIKP